jgi:hypothetical protein
VGTATTLFIFAYGNFETANHVAVAVGRRKTNHYTPWHFLSKTINKDTDLRSATPSLQFNYNGLACRVQQLEPVSPRKKYVQSFAPCLWVRPVSARFLQVAWLIIRLNIMTAFDAFCHLDMRNFHNVNGALMVLLPKSTEASTDRLSSHLSNTYCW